MSGRALERHREPGSSRDGGQTRRSGRGGSRGIVHGERTLRASPRVTPTRRALDPLSVRVDDRRGARHGHRHMHQVQEPQGRLKGDMGPLPQLELTDEPRAHAGLCRERGDGDPLRPSRVTERGTESGNERGVGIHDLNMANWDGEFNPFM